MSQKWRELVKRRREGQVLVLFALMSFVLIGFLALSVDAGYLMKERRDVQAAADAAAIAGGLTMLNGGDSSAILAAASEYAALNGIDLDAASVSIDPEMPDEESNGTGEVVVEITQDVERFFIGAIYTGEWQVGARAVAAITDDTPGNYALMALDPPGMYVNGNMEIQVLDGGAMSNGDVSNSSSGPGGSNANVFQLDTVLDAHGSINGANSNWTAPGGLNDNRPAVTDPLAGAVAPSEPATPGVHDCGGNSDCAMSPGLYEDVNITIKKTAMLAAGVYYFTGSSSLKLQNQQARLEGDGVMLYFTGSSEFDPKNGEVSIVAPPSGVELYSGMPNRMALWIENCSSFEAQGSGELYFEGMFYAPCSYVWLHGNPNGDTINGQVIVGELDLRGNTNMTVQYNNLVDTPRHEVYLTE